MEQNYKIVVSIEVGSNIARSRIQIQQPIKDSMSCRSRLPSSAASISVHPSIFRRRQPIKRHADNLLTRFTQTSHSKATNKRSTHACGSVSKMHGRRYTRDVSTSVVECWVGGLITRWRYGAMTVKGGKHCLARNKLPLSTIISNNQSHLYGIV